MCWLSRFSRSRLSRCCAPATSSGRSRWTIGDWPGAECRALVYGRQEAGSPVYRAAGRLASCRVEHDVGRQVGIGAAQRVLDPGAQRWPARIQVAGVELEDRDIVRRAYGLARLDEGELVGLLGQVRQQVGKPRAALAVLFPGLCPIAKSLPTPPCVLVLMPFRKEAGTSWPASLTSSGL